MKTPDRCALTDLRNPHNPYLPQDKRTVFWYRRHRYWTPPPTAYPPICDIWNAAQRIDGTPAARYIAGRLGGTPEGELAALRWLPADNDLRWSNGDKFAPPQSAAGWLAAAYYQLSLHGRYSTEPHQIQLLPLNRHGHRLPHHQHRKAKTYGRASGTITACPALLRPDAETDIVVVAESVITALAGDILDGSRAALVISAGGTSGADICHLLRKRNVRYHADGDPAGRQVAALIAAHAICYPDGTDAADSLKDRINRTRQQRGQHGRTNTEYSATNTPSNR